MRQFIRELSKAFEAIATEENPRSKGAGVGISENRFLITDGPFVETKEHIAASVIQPKTGKKRSTRRRHPR